MPFLKEEIVMKILHYTLGLPPYRSGGLTKYSHDLMVEQAKQGDEIFLLFPGKMRNGDVKIKYYSKYKNINVYELINSLPVPLLQGVSKPIEFMKKCNKDIFKNFLNGINVDIVHIHTFMGLYREFLEASKELHIKIVYTSHDYYGLCTKVNFIDYNGEICNERNLDKCIKCNFHGYSLSTIKILQSSIYRLLKNKGVISKVKKLISNIKRLKSNSSLSKDSKTSFEGSIDKIQYKNLLGYYQSMYSYIDGFLFNSTVSKSIYNKYLDTKGKVIPVTHSGIKDNRRKKCYENKELKLTYLGPYKEYKGFNLLLEVMESLLEEEYEDIVLNAYGDNDIYHNPPKNMKINGKYSHSQLEKIFNETDLLLVPSIWYETFGFVTLEALSYGVPVLITENVGSKDITCNNLVNKGIVISASKNEIRDEIIKVFNNRDILKRLNNNILNDKFYGLMGEHYYNINSLYLEIMHD